MFYKNKDLYVYIYVYMTIHIVLITNIIYAEKNGAILKCEYYYLIKPGNNLTDKG